ncbi:MAG: CpaB family protein [Ferrimicrobium sp.]
MKKTTIPWRRISLHCPARAFGLVLAVALLSVAIGISLSSSLQPPTRIVAVAKATIEPGSPIVPNDLTTEALSTSPGRSTWPFLTPTMALQRFAAIPIHAGSIIEAQMTESSRVLRANREITIAISSLDVPPAVLQPGARVDLAATYGQGTGASTIAIATQLPVIGVVDNTTSATTDITLAVPALTVALAVAQAQQLGKLTVIDATHVHGDNQLLAYPPALGAQNG